MKCPMCSHENLDGAVRCASCKRPLNRNDSSSGVKVKLSRVAIVSPACAVVSWICCVPGIISELDPFVLDPELDMVTGLGVLAFFAAGLGFLVGIGGLADIASSGGRRTGYGFAVIGTAAPAIFILAVMYAPATGAFKQLPSHIACQTNLSGMGKAMLIYANDYYDMLPAAGGDGTVWGPGLSDWAAASRAEAFGLDPNGAGGQATISASLYLWLKYADVSPKSFVCRGDRQTDEFKPELYRTGSSGLFDLWDFGPNPAQHCSYAYHILYGRYALTTSSEPGMAVAADRNPWIDEPRRRAADFSLFQPDIAPFGGTAEQVRRGNTRGHRYDGQNILFLDSHVEFGNVSFGGVLDNNIYTSWDGDDKARGTPPELYRSQPAGREDALLVNDPPIDR